MNVPTYNLGCGFPKTMTSFCINSDQQRICLQESDIFLSFCYKYCTVIRLIYTVILWNICHLRFWGDIFWWWILPASRNYQHNVAIVRCTLENVRGLHDHHGQQLEVEVQGTGHHFRESWCYEEENIWDKTIPLHHWSSVEIGSGLCRGPQKRENERDQYLAILVEHAWSLTGLSQYSITVTIDFYTKRAWIPPRTILEYLLHW